MRVLISAVGEIRPNDPEGIIISDYIKRMPWQVSVKTIDSKKIKSTGTKSIEESEALLKLIPPQTYIVALDNTGKEYSSVDFAGFLERLANRGVSSVAFVIGGAYGHHEMLIKKSDHVLSLGKMTFSHKLARVMLVEQIYRAYTIINNHPYGK